MSPQLLLSFNYISLTFLYFPSSFFIFVITPAFTHQLPVACTVRGFLDSIQGGCAGAAGFRGCDAVKHVRRGVCVQPRQDVHCLTLPEGLGQSQQNGLIYLPRILSLCGSGATMTAATWCFLTMPFILSSSTRSTCYTI